MLISEQVVTGLPNVQKAHHMLHHAAKSRAPVQHKLYAIPSAAITKTMKSFLIKILIVFTLFISHGNYSQNTISPDDLNMISGKWQGTLTYIDYSTNKPFTMPANVIVEQGKNEYQVQLLINYPKEPNANSKDKINISKDGLLVNKTRVISREVFTNQEVKITTEYSGKDNREKALIRNVYIFGPKRFIIRKEVKFDDLADWLMRNEFSFVR